MKPLSSLFLRSLTTAIMIFTAGVSEACFGQQASSDLAEASLEELGSIQVYSASKRLQSAGEAPASVTVISADEIQRHGYRTLADVLRTVRSFYVTYDRIYSSLGVRGFARPGDFNTRILLLVDGHRLNDNIYDEAMIGTEFPIDLDLIQRIEIVRGPISSLYGSNALFAVLNIITKGPEDINGLTFSTEVGSFNTYKARLSYGREMNGFNVLASGSFYRSLGPSQLFYPEFNFRDSNGGIASHMDSDQVGTAFGAISSHHFTLEAAYGTREKGIPTGAYETIFNDPRTRTTDSHGYADLRYEHTFHRSLDMLARVFYDRYTYQGTYMYRSTDPGQINANLDYGDGQWWGTDIQLTASMPRKNRFTIGGEYRNNVRQKQVNRDLTPPSLLLNDERQSFVAALLLQDEIAISKSVSLNLGVRYDYYSAVSSSTDPRAALVWNPWRRTALKAIYGEAFRVPNVYEKYYSIAPNAPNPALRPEKIHSAELVWEQDMLNYLRLSVSTFQNSLNGIITQQSLDNGSFVFENLQKVGSKGIELEVNGRRSSGFESSGSYSFQRTEDRDSERPLSNSPQQIAKLNLSQPLLRNRVFASVDAQYRGKMTTFSGRSVSPFALLNSTILGHDLGKHLDISAGVYNLLNEKYYDPPSTAVSLESIKQDGRTFRFTMTWRSGAR